MKRIISGITATGNLHIGNYLGTIKNLISEQEKNNELFVFVADLHGLSAPIDPNLIKKNIKEIIKLYLACGLDPKKTKLFIQSHIKEHSELYYLLTTLTNIGQLNRMIQFKEKTIKQKNKTDLIPTGILMYPVLMAADIILYNPNVVLVGQDQKQHIELTKIITERLNKNYDLSFNIVEPQIAKKEEGSKIMSLKNPENKMSKSDKNENNTIFLLDNEEVVRRKIAIAITDSENKIYYDESKKPGISNLIVIYSQFTNMSISEIEDKFKLSTYKDFKEEVGNVIINTLNKIQKKYYSLTDQEILKSLNQNRQEIQSIAKNNIDIIKEKMGLLNYDK